MSPNTPSTPWYCAILLSVSLPAAAQQPTAASPAVTQPSQTSAQAEAGEPRADTGAMEAAPPAARPAPAVPASAPAPDSQRAAAPPTGGPAGGTPGAAAPVVRSSPAGAPAAVTPAAPSKRASTGGNAAATGQKSTAVDRLDLGVATVTGEREQPKVMYIVPWKKSDIGDLSGKPMHSLLDEALAPVDRDEFKREVVYYQAVNADASQNGAPRQPAKQGEK